MTDEVEDNTNTSEGDITIDVGKSTGNGGVPSRIDIIGQNGNDGEHYNYDKCVRYPDDD